MALSSAWKKKASAYVLIIILDILALGLSVSVNIFQEFFFGADLLPLLLSIATLVILLLQVAFDLKSENAFTARPVFEIPLFGILTVTWLVVNSFSTSRYTSLPNCLIFTDDLDGEQAWCRNVQALRIIIWVEWMFLLLTTLTLTRTAIIQARCGNTAIWHTALSRYNRNNQSRDFLQDASSFYRGSSIFAFDRATGSQKTGSRDWFAPAEPAIRLSDNFCSQRDSDAGSFFGSGATSLSALGHGSQSAIPLRDQFQIQTPRSARSATATKTVDGFEIISTGHYFQNESIWGRAMPQPKS